MPDKFKITEQVDLKDYLYDGNAMRTLSGKKLHKKKNHLNAFKREYEADMSTAVCAVRTEVMSGSFWIAGEKKRAKR